MRPLRPERIAGYGRPVRPRSDCGTCYGGCAPLLVFGGRTGEVGAADEMNACVVE